MEWIARALAVLIWPWMTVPALTVTAWVRGELSAVYYYSEAWNESAIAVEDGQEEEEEL